MARRHVKSRKGKARATTRRTRKNVMTGGTSFWKRFRGKSPTPKSSGNPFNSPVTGMFGNHLAPKVLAGSVPESAFTKGSQHSVVSVGTGFVPPTRTLRNPENGPENNDKKSPKPPKSSKAPVKPDRNPLSGFNTRAMEQMFETVAAQQKTQFRTAPKSSRQSNINPLNAAAARANANVARLAAMQRHNPFLNTQTTAF